MAGNSLIKKLGKNCYFITAIPNSKIKTLTVRGEKLNKREDLSSIVKFGGPWLEALGWKPQDKYDVIAGENGKILIERK